MTTDDLVIGLALYGQDNPGYFYRGADIEACPACGLVIDADWMNPTFRHR
jgi:hypothetical protein